MKNLCRFLPLVFVTLTYATVLLMTGCIGPIDENDILYSELESVWQYLKAYSIYQDSSIYEGRIPSDPFVYEEPAELMRTVCDTLYGEYYTVYGVISSYRIGNACGTCGDGYQFYSSRLPAVILDTLTDSTVRISITSFDYGVTYSSLINILSGVSRFPFIVIDLRGNGGGDIDETKAIVDAFIPSGKGYIMAREREYDYDKRYACTVGWHAWKTKDLARPELSGKRYTVLMDRNSASASEILIAALKDCVNATLVGGRSFGKAIGQIKIYRRDRPGMQITFLQMRGISERIGDYHHKGIEPDVSVEGSEQEVLLTAVKVHEPSVTRLRRLRKENVSTSPVGAYRVIYE